MILQVKVMSDKLEMIDVYNLINGVDYQVISRKRIRLLNTVMVNINGEAISIKAGFEWNGASVPQMFWASIGKPTNEDFALASLVHDYLYAIKFNRDVADAVFRKLLDMAGVNGRRVALMWGAVRVGGHIFYAARANNNKISTRFWRGAVKFLYGRD